MNNIKDKFLAKIENKGTKKSIENLVAFVIILIATIIFINYIWNGDKKKTNGNSKQSNITMAETKGISQEEDSTGNNFEKQLENILKKINGVDDVQVLITYSETNKIVPIYNEDSQQSTTKEEDNQGRDENYKRKFK